MKPSKELVKIIAGKIGKPKEHREDDYRSQGYEQASKEMLKAIENGDSFSFAHSLKNFIEMCKNEG